ncbi:hypothetical protein HHI36_022016, partial [Cryptolaemus montrouzieri]
KEQSSQTEIADLMSDVSTQTQDEPTEKPSMIRMNNCTQTDDVETSMEKRIYEKLKLSLAGQVEEEIIHIMYKVSREISDVQQTLENGRINKPLDSLGRDVSEAVNEQNPNSDKRNRQARSIYTKYDGTYNTRVIVTTEYKKNVYKADGVNVSKSQNFRDRASIWYRGECRRTFKERMLYLSPLHSIIKN